MKVVFEGSASPRLWWDQLAQALLVVSIHTAHGRLQLVRHELDSCLFLLVDKDNQLFGILAAHVNNILITAPTPLRKALEQALSGEFPVDAWEEASGGLEYWGMTMKQDNQQVTLSQENFVNNCLQTVDIPKGAQLEDQADEATKMNNQSTVGALSRLASLTRPDIQVGAPMAQRKQKSPTYDDIKATNHVVRMAQREKDEKLAYRKLGGWQDLVVIVYHDAAWANVTNEYDHVDYTETNDTGIYSRLGYVVVITHRNTLLGETGTGIVAAWKSHTCQRVCRSTFASETMAALDGWKAGLKFRDFLRGCFPAGCPGELPLLSMTDCKSLYDSVHRAGGPRAPSEKRLLADLATLRQMVQQEFAAWSPRDRVAFGRSLKSIPTGCQLADGLTKLLTKGSWRSNLKALKAAGSTV